MILFGQRMTVHSGTVIQRQRGFTLVELMVTMAIVGLVLSAVYMAYRAQSRSYDVAEQVVAVQQNMRVVGNMMAKEIRMAGYDPLEKGVAGVIAASATRFRFTTDSTEDGDVGDPNEDIEYGFATADDADSDGLADTGAANLGRQTGGAGGFQAIAENVEAIAYAYAYDADGDGELDTSAGGNIIWARDTGGDGDWDNLDTNDDGAIAVNDAVGGVISGSDTGTAVDITDIRAVRVWTLGRAGKPDSKFTNTNTYVVGHNIVTANDRYRRRLTDVIVVCRNLGL